MLSFDIQVQIIKKLPIKSLIRFRSVCNAWKSLIDTSHFIASYNDRDDLPHHLVVMHEVGRYEEESKVNYVSFVDDDTFPQNKISLTVPPIVQGKNIIGSSHGLLCCFRDPYDSSETNIVVLWNPAIRKSVVVVVPDVIHRRFDYVLGFGVCPDTKDPKLVRITYIDNYKEMGSISRIPCQVMVFSLSSGEWTCLCSSSLPRKTIRFTRSQTVVGRFIYWHAYDHRFSVYGEYRKIIMSFDMSTQEFGEVYLPDSLAELRDSSLSVARVRESLAVVEYCGVFEGLTWRRFCSVWMMEHGDFTKLFTINLPNASISRTIGFRKSGEPVVEICDDYRNYYSSCALAVYEPGLEHIKDLGICGTRFSFAGSFYTESLLLLDHEDGRIVRYGAV